MILHYDRAERSDNIKVYFNNHYLGLIRNNGFYADSSRVFLSTTILLEIANKIKANGDMSGNL